MRATKLIPELYNCTYEQRLQTLKMSTLYYRRIRTDILQLFRIVKGFDNVNLGNDIDISTNITRGHSLKLTKTRCLKRSKLDRFPWRSINMWNELPEYAVSCNTINSFKNALSKFWAEKPYKYSLNI